MVDFGLFFRIGVFIVSVLWLVDFAGSTLETARRGAALDPALLTALPSQ